MEKKKTISSRDAVKELAAFIVRNFHHCPIKDDVEIPDCEGWRSEHCKKCIMQHANELQ